MILDCDTCPGRGRACSGCVVAEMLDPRASMDPATAAAVTVLLDAELIGPVHLSLVPEQQPTRQAPLVGRRRVG